MSSIKKTLMQKGMKLMADPRVMKLMQDERVMKAVMTAMSVPGKAQSLAKDQLENVARAMALATEGEMKDLRRTVRKLEDELAKMKREQSGDKTPGSKKKPPAPQSEARAPPSRPPSHRGAGRSACSGGRVVRPRRTRSRSSACPRA